jgi:hypothetical protein
MYYKMNRLETILRAHEVATGITYKKVIWMRPDIKINNVKIDVIKSCLNMHGRWCSSSFASASAFGDYFMILPRLAFFELSKIYSRILSTRSSVLTTWRPKLSFEPDLEENDLSILLGPETIFNTLYANGYFPFGIIPTMNLTLCGYVPNKDIIMESFSSEKK